MDFSSFQPYASNAAYSSHPDQSRRSMPFALPVSSYFRRPSRVTKTTRTQSPKHLVRRKTTTSTHGHHRTQTSDELSQYRSQTANPERPISWHPTSFGQVDDSSQFSQPNFFPTYDFSNINPFSTTEVNGLVTPLAMPIPNEPQIQELIAPLSELSADDYSHNFNFMSSFDVKSNPYYFFDVGHSFQGSNVDYSSQYLPFQPEYPTQSTTYSEYRPNLSNLNIATAPPSPNLLPTQHFDGNRVASPFALGSPRVDNDELRGLGLYDKPKDVQHSSLLLGSGGPSPTMSGKGLKLEESFVPPPAEYDEEGEEEGEEEDDDDDEDQSQDADVNADEMESSTATITGHLPPQIYVDEPQTYVDQSFFYDDKPAGGGYDGMADPVDYAYYSNYGWSAPAVVGHQQPQYGWI